MLIVCPECELQVSDKAITCPHCGYPLKEISQNSSPGKFRPRKYKRLPNGFGQITEIKNQNLRNRFRVMVSEGKTEYGKPIQKMLKPRAYFPSYKEAYEALLEYHKNPYEIDQETTMEELYDKWFEKFSEHAGLKSKQSYAAAWKYCDQLYSIPVKDIRIHHLKTCLETAEREYKGETKLIPPSMRIRVKQLFNVLFDYAIELGIVDKNYSRMFKLSEESVDLIKESKKNHMAFTDEEISILWKNKNAPGVSIILIQCYMGWRPRELATIELNKIDLDRNIITGGLKTDAGRERIVPIHPKVKPLVEEAFTLAKESGSDKLFVIKGAVRNTKYKPLTYDKYFARFISIMEELGLNPEHRPHDPRKHFITMAKKYNLDEYAIKRIVGHTIKDLTEAVYTERDPEWLYEEVCKIP